MTAFDYFEANHIIREITFNQNIEEVMLNMYCTKLRKSCGKKSHEYALAKTRLDICRKRKMRNDRRLYSTKIQFAQITTICSGFSPWEFDCTESRKANFIAPLSVVNKGNCRKNSTFKTYTSWYSLSRVYVKYEYAPIITSYIHYTRKRVIVCLENRVYKIRNAGNGFHFFVHQQNVPIVDLVHDKSELHTTLTALDIIHNLPKIRKNLRKKFNHKNEKSWKV